MSDSFKVAWVEDTFALNVLQDLGLNHLLIGLPISAIDRKRSGQNSARLSAKLDEENVLSLVLGIQHGDSIPYLVVRKVIERGLVKYIVAGGNHRLEALTRCGYEDLKAYCVECGDTEFLVLCQRLNLANGKGVSEKDRVAYAAAALASGIAETQKIAADMFRVSQSRLKEFIKLEQAEQKLFARTGKNINLPIKVKVALGRVQSDEVHDAALDLAVAKGANSNEVSKVISEAIKLPTVADQLDAIKKAHVVTSCERKVVSPKRRVFLSAIGTLHNMLQKHSTLQSFDIVDDKESVLELIELVASKLKVLAK